MSTPSSGACSDPLHRADRRRYPIVQTGMGWVSGARLTAATAAAGGLGIIASSTMSVPELETAIRAVKETHRRAVRRQHPLRRLDVGERVDLMIRLGREGRVVRAGAQEGAAAEAEGRRRRHDAVGRCRRHAEKVAGWGADAVLVQGGEGGGHTGSVPTTLLLPQVVDAVDIPVVAAGGFFDGRGLVAALAYGARRSAMGTRFLLTCDSNVSNAVKEIYLSTDVNGTVVTTAVDGMPHRVLRTELVDKLVKAGPVGRLPRAVRNAVAFQKESGTPWTAMLREGKAMKAGPRARAGARSSWPPTPPCCSRPRWSTAALTSG